MRAGREPIAARGVPCNPLEAALQRQEEHLTERRHEEEHQEEDHSWQ